MASDVLTGKSFPLGATVYPDGVNFSVFSKNSYAVELLLFDAPDAPKPARIIPLDPQRGHNKTFYYWHTFVRGLQHGQAYAYRIQGPFQPERGLRFDGNKVLLDPYARAVAMGLYQRERAAQSGDNMAHSLRGVVVDTSRYDWEGDLPLNRPYSETVIYEMHVAGFTKHPSSGLPPALRGTYRGLIEKIPYLQSLGITAVELLPVQQFDPHDAPTGKANYWGYSPLNFFTPHHGYASQANPLAVLDEFRDMVKALHRAGIEVILDVVFNHTAEGNHEGPTFSFRGFENNAYYILENQRAYYANYSGTGNTLKGNHSIVRRLIMDCLRYWVSEMHVDGFRFDLASVMSRDEYGNLLQDPPILWEIESDPVLAGTKIIAEAWDAVGLYQVGSFVGHRWAEWNGQYRDDVRRFIKSDEAMVGRLAARITASPDLYSNQQDREPNRSINFITCHDGFTLNDLVSYNQKHNEANGEANRDGNDSNHSWNCGAEGETSDPHILQLRRQQIKNALLMLFTSQGTPMILMGDEVRRSQHGNNNAYCQDNELSWFDWSALERERETLNFLRGLITFTQRRAIFRDEEFWTAVSPPRVTWHGTQLYQPDWGANSRSLAFTLSHPKGDYLHIIYNAYWEALEFELPPRQRGAWLRIADTALPHPHDFADIAQAPIHSNPTYLVAGRSCVILLAEQS